MHSSISADFAFTPSGIQSHVLLSLGAEGEVLDLQSYSPGPDGLPLAPPPGHTHYRGLLSPGFVNAHCHLELSHLKGLLPKGTGMTAFVTQLQSIRFDISDADRARTISAAIEELYQGGTVAVGDICNGNTTLKPKSERPEMWFHNFCEMLSLRPGTEETALHRGIDLAMEYGGRSNVTPHAPYTMSVAFRNLVYQQVRAREMPLSIHLLESEEEVEMFTDLSGPLMAMIRGLGLPFGGHTYDTPLDFVLEGLPQEVSSLLVHCTELDRAGMERIATSLPRAQIVLCPLANLYIHEKLPPARMLLDFPDRVCLGTDSLASNDQLDLVAEMSCLQEAFDLPLEILLRWATVNGARALELPESAFRIAIGARPRLVLIEDLAQSESGKLSLNPESKGKILPT